MPSKLGKLAGKLGDSFDAVNMSGEAINVGSLHFSERITHRTISNVRWVKCNRKIKSNLLEVDINEIGGIQT